jgi:hypothetical protein
MRGSYVGDREEDHLLSSEAMESGISSLTFRRFGRRRKQQAQYRGFTALLILH